MKSLVASLCCFLLLSTANSQSFEGRIQFTFRTPKDTTTNVYQVKGDKVRLDQYGSKSKNVEGSFLFDLKAKKITGINHTRKMYDEVKPAAAPAKIPGKFTVKKSNETKSIQGMKCTKYVVTNTEDKTIYNFYIAQNKFDFFAPLMALWNRKDKASVYFQQITGLKGAFPMLAIQTDIVGNEKERIEVTQVEKKTVDATAFQAPQGYKQYQD